MKDTENCLNRAIQKLKGATQDEDFAICVSSGLEHI